MTSAVLFILVIKYSPGSFILFCPALEVVDLHCMLDLSKGLRCLCSCSICSLSQGCDDFFRMSFEVSSLLSDRCQELVQDSEQEFLDLDVSESASSSISFEFIEILVFT